MHVERLLSLSNLILVMNMIYQPLLCFSITTQLTYPSTDGRVTITQSGYNEDVIVFDYDQPPNETHTLCQK